MTRLLTLAALVAGFSLFASYTEAGDWYHGGHGVHHGHRHAHGGGYAVAPYSGYGYGGFYGGQPYGYGNHYGYQSRFRGGYAPRYRSYRHHQHGGLHVDVGRLHFGLGEHHH